MSRNIRSIRIGDVFAGKLITVGQEHTIADKKIKIVAISHDLDYLKSFGVDKFDVYVKDTLGWGNEFIWQSFQRQPVCVTYECVG